MRVSKLSGLVLNAARAEAGYAYRYEASAPAEPERDRKADQPTAS